MINQFISACVYICVYACMCVCVCVCLCTCACVFVYMCMCVYVCARMRDVYIVCTCMRMRICSYLRDKEFWLMLTPLKLVYSNEWLCFYTHAHCETNTYVLYLIISGSLSNNSSFNPLPNLSIPTTSSSLVSSPTLLLCLLHSAISSARTDKC